MNYKAKSIEIKNLMNEIKANYDHEYVITKGGNGQWYHTFQDPLGHKWHDLDGFTSICHICGMTVELKIKFK
jgi:hypothetical protein